MYACLAVTCHLHFWQNDRDFLRATAVTRGWNGYRNKSQHRKSTLEKKILPPFQQGFEPATFQSRVRCSNHWAIPAPQSSVVTNSVLICINANDFRFLDFRYLGKIQGDGRKFLDRFKSYFGSQIPQSPNEVHIYRLQPKSATKGEFFSSYIFVFDCFKLASRIAI